MFADSRQKKKTSDTGWWWDPLASFCEVYISVYISVASLGSNMHELQRGVGG